MKNDNVHNLSRFIHAQEGVIENVLAELENGRKRSHWMWFIFPQIDGLGHSATSIYYSIKSKEAAQDYLHHPLLWKRLLTCAGLTLAIEGKSAREIFGHPDDMKLQSSMTLFACITDPGSVFERVLDKYFDGKRDEKTVELLRNFTE